MAKKSNKTEQVLKLITKESEVQDPVDNTEPSDVKTAKEGPNAPADSDAPQVEIDVQPAKPQESKIEAKLKIEIEPEIEIKQKEKPQEELHIKVPVSTDAAKTEPVKPAADDIGETPQGKVSAEEAPVHSQEAPAKPARTYLINLTEMLAREKVKEVMQRINVCDCPTCTQDVLALTLNSLPNKFVNTDAGRQHLLLEIYKKQYETDIVAALTRASVRVKVTPRH